MKKLNKFQAENSNTIKAIEENAQSSFKGGKLSPKSMFGMESGNPIEVVGQKPNKFADVKVFSSFTELKAFLFGGK